MTSLIKPVNIKVLSEGIKNENISPTELVEISLEKIKKFDSILNSFITVLEDNARNDAKRAEKQIKEGKYLGPLHGIPFSIKDVICAHGVRCTAGSKILSNFISQIEATSVTKMKNSGAILIGTNNTHEFACGITNVNPHFGSSKNPWNISRLSGGSSGGSAVSVSAGFVPVSLATDTSGSIRVPSALCGVVGLKPTYGRVSKYGIIDLAPSLDHVGCITRSVWDAAMVLQTIAGQDPLDKTTKDKKIPDFTKVIEDSSNMEEHRYKIGIPKEYFFDFLDPQVEKIFQHFVDKLKSMGINSSQIHLNKANKIYDSWRPLRLAESAEIHQKWLDDRPKEYGDDVLKMLTQGTQIPAVDYIRAQKFREEIRTEFIKIMKRTDVVIMPTTPIAAPRFNEHEVTIGDKTMQIYQTLSRHTIAFDSTGLPAISIPIGFTKDNLPVGVQIIGPPFREEKILNIAYAYECENESIKKFTPTF